MTKKSTIFILVIILSFLSVHIAFAQAPDIEWEKTYGGSGDEVLWSIYQTVDGGYILGGYSQSGISGDKSEDSQGNSDYWIVKLDSNGNIEWDKTIGGDSVDKLYSIQQTTDGGYILGGWSLSGISGDKTESSKGSYDYWVVKIDSGGNIQWQKTYGGSDEDKLWSIQQTTDGGYIVGGHSKSGVSGDKTESNKGSYDYWIIKLNSSGGIQWQKTIGGDGSDSLFSLNLTTDGGYIIGGSSSSSVSGDKTEEVRRTDFWIVKLNGNGDIEWQNTIGGDQHDFGPKIIQTTDGRFFLGGTSNSGVSYDKTDPVEGPFKETDYWVLMLDQTGQTIEWQNTIGSWNYEQLWSIQQTKDTGYIIGGISRYGKSGDKIDGAIGGEDYWVLKLDGYGEIVWQKIIGSNDADRLYSLQQTIDEGYILGGFSNSNIGGNKSQNSKGGFDYWVVKLSPDAQLGIEKTKLIEGFKLLSAYPNPFNPNTTIKYSLEARCNVTVEIYNIVGELISRLINKEQNSGWHTVIWNGTNQRNESVPAGLYISKIIAGNEFKTSKLMLLK